MLKPILRTVLGDIPLSDLGMILPHEHLFTDLRGPDAQSYAQDDPDLVLQVLHPHLSEAEKAGVTALIECSTIGVGRNISILRQIAEHSSIHIVAPTGIYKQDFTPEPFKTSTINDLCDLWIQELTQSIESSPSKAGFIKIAVSDDGPTALEVRNIRAAARVSMATGAAVASHTIGGRAAWDEIQILQEEGLNLDRFIWVHADSEADLDFHHRIAALGAYVEFDFIGQPGTDPEATVEKIRTLLDKNLGDRILLSHDAGWFQPGNPNGQPEGGIRGYTYLTDEFIPLLLQRGFDPQTIKQLVEDNPKKAFAMLG